VTLGLVNLVLLAAIVSGAKGLGSGAPASTGDESLARKVRMMAKFDLAMQRARDPRPEDVRDDLLALVPGMPGLKWYPDEKAPGAKVLVATWTRYDGFRAHQGVGCKLAKAKSKPGDEKSKTEERYTWVTPFPQLEDTCRGFKLSGPALHERTIQYLGLRIDDDRPFVVELWVDPNDTFRPCADPETGDRKCDLGLPKLDGKEAKAGVLDHAGWFSKQFAYYYDQNPYPWTRLGYTYDWGDSDHHVGASEYVIRPGVSVWVAGVSSLDDYCRADPAIAREIKDWGAGNDDC
jgi:hypothetical protein